MADYLIYIVPDSEPIPDPTTCAPCGSFVRRGEQWYLPASGSSEGVHTLRVLQSDKDGFSLVDKHVMYMREQTTADAVRDGFDLVTIPANDDLSSPYVAIGFDADFCGVAFNHVYVNTNGNITLDAALSTYTPFDMTTTTTKIIGCFFADVETRFPGGDLVSYGQGFVEGRKAFAVNYINVNYYDNDSPPRNTFQLLLIERLDVGPGKFDIEYNYDTILWETGNASGGVNGLGGVSARVGYSNGGSSSFELAGSGVNGAFLDSGPSGTSLIHNSLNSGVIGRYVFNICHAAVPAFTLASGDLNNYKYPYVVRSDISVNARTTAQMPVLFSSSLDIINNPTEYSVEIGGEVLLFKDVTNYLEWYSNSTTSTLLLSKANGDLFGDSLLKCQVAGYTTVLEHSSNIKIYKNGTLVSNTDFHFVTTALVYDVRCTSVTVTLLVGDYFELLDDPFNVYTVIDNR